MPSHPDLVTAFRDGLRDGALPAGVTARDPAEAPRRFAVYRNNVAHGLTEALASRFPVVQRLVGEDFFRAMAGVFATAHPPPSPVLLAWGEAFPEFLRGFPPVQGLPYLPDVARIEIARGQAFHAADREPLPPEALAQAARDPADARLGLHPSVRVVPSRWTIVSIWRANQPGATPAALRADQPETALILRERAFGVPVHPLAPGDAAFLAGLRTGAALLACANAGTRAQARHDPGPLLALLAQAGALIAPDPAPDPAPDTEDPT